jgi:N-acetylglutamate synthase-like GNAT family acetyltransferase
MDIIIRDATPADIKGIADVIVPIQQLEYGIDITYEQQPDLVDIPGYYQTGAGGFWVAVADGTVVGTISLKDIGSREAALRKMFVQENFRGKPYGVAGKLLQHLLNHARERNLKTIYLGTTPKFLAAHKFYEKNGFDLIDAGELPAPFPIMKVDTRFYKFAL